MTSAESTLPPEQPRPPESAPSREVASLADLEPLILPRPPQTPTREWFTFAIALALVLAFVGIIAVVVLAWVLTNVNELSLDDVIRLLITVSGIMAGLVGAVAGYYFRGREEAARRGELGGL